MTNDEVLRLFSVDSTVMKRLLERGLARGADYADLFFEYRMSSLLFMEDSLLKNASRGIERGVGIRVVKDDQVGFAYTDILTYEAMCGAMDTAANIANGNKRLGVADLTSRKILDLYPVSEPVSLASVSRKLELIRRADNAARAESSYTKGVNVTLTDNLRHLLFANSEGVMWTDTQPLLRLDVATVVEKDGDRQSGSASGGGRIGFAYFDKRSPEDLAKDSVRVALLQLEAKEAPAGQMPVVLGAGDSGILLHEAVGHGLEADFNRKSLSNYAGRVGQPVASELCTVVDSGMFEHSRGAINVDDEGHEPGETVLIRNGILEGYLHDRISAKMTGQPTTGNGRRESYRCVPLPRMTNTYLLPGEDDPEDIIKSVEYGVYARRFAGGQVDITKGDYVFAVVEGYLIEKGRITSPVKNITLIGNGPETMTRVSMVGSDIEHSDGMWTCGKHGQMVPVGVGMPTVKISEMTVGGTQSRG